MWAKLFLIASCICAAAPQCHAEDPKPEKLIVTDDHSIFVFVGNELEMPLDGSKQIALQPRRDRNGGIVVPKTLSSAFEFAREALPRWYVVAVRASQREYECSVMVNDSPMHLATTRWFAKSWGAHKEGTALYGELRSLGIPKNPFVVNEAMNNGICAFLKTGSIDTAMAEIAAFKSQANLR